MQILLHLCQLVCSLQCMVDMFIFLLGSYMIVFVCENSLEPFLLFDEPTLMESDFALNDYIFQGTAQKEEDELMLVFMYLNPHSQAPCHIQVHVFFHNLLTCMVQTAIYFALGKPRQVDADFALSDNERHGNKEVH